jgi:UDP-GlcNAc:undecaprenyl-phosphate/decaprenyl-phosphate GlcNAc-1-phosphate transferase
VTVVGAFLAFVVTVVFLFVLRPVAEQVGLVDVPGGVKRHDDDTPLIGGIAMAVGLGFGSSLVGAPEYWQAVLLAVYLLVAVGTVDDRHQLLPSVRLVAHSCAAMLVVLGAGVTVSHLGSPLFFELPLGPVAAIFSILFIITLINAFNIIDGLDGLAGGLALIALLAGAIISYGTELFILVMLLLAVVSGFLIFNLPVPVNRPVRVFMGDAGSTSLGLAIAAVGIALSQAPAASMAPVVGLWLIAVPVFDIFSAVVRRLAESRSIFEPDHDHMHHVLIEQGMSRHAALGVMLGIAGLFALVGVLAHFAGTSDGVLLLAWLSAGILYYQVMRHPEWVFRRGEAEELAGD